MERAVEIQCCLLGYVIRKGCEYTGCSYWLHPDSLAVCKHGHRWALPLCQGHSAMWLCTSFCQCLFPPPPKWELVWWLALINSMWLESSYVCSRLYFNRLCMLLLPLPEAGLPQGSKPRRACWKMRSHWEERHGVLTCNKPDLKWLQTWPKWQTTQLN